MLHESCTSLQLTVPVGSRAGAMAHGMVLVAVSWVQDVEESMESALYLHLIGKDFLQLLACRKPLLRRGGLGVVIVCPLEVHFTSGHTCSLCRILAVAQRCLVTL